MEYEPSLKIDSDICQKNIAQMAKKAHSSDIRFKPHMKTHQSAHIGEWIRDHGVEAITVSSIQMAQYFAKHDWDDITIAMPAHPGQASAINGLAEDRTITLLINDGKIADLIDKELSNNVQVYIEFDSGSHRTGIAIDEKPKIDKLIQTLQSSNNLYWTGFYSHPGHTYNTRSKKEVKEIHQQVLRDCRKLRDDFEPADRRIEICIGDTPSCSVASDFTGIDAISPGNFVFYDLMQYQIGSCEISDIAVIMQCPIIDCYPQRSEVVVHGGAVHFSKETLSHQRISHYGMLAEKAKDGQHWKMKQPESFLTKLSQEHGTLHCPDAEQYDVGQQLNILPVHSCLTAHLMGRFKLDGQADHHISQM